MRPENTTQERIIDAAVALLAGSPDQKLNRVQLNKALFYLDLVNLRDEGETLTGSAYIALAQGPVLAHYEKRLIRPLLAAGLAVAEENGKARPLKLQEKSRSQGLTTAQRARAQQVAAWVREQHTSTSISEKSHENLGWQLARRDGERARRPQPINLLIALQQISDRDPWLDDLGDEEFRLEAALAQESASERW